MEKQILDTEREYLNNTILQIDKMKARDNKRIKQNEESISSFKKYFAENYYDIRHGNGKEIVGEDEFANINLSIENCEVQNIALKKEISRLSKQKKSPYFGRFDFRASDQKETMPFYIGLGLIQNEAKQNLVFDWRADICSLYYDDKIGETSYFCPDGEICGKVSLKRQFKIEDGELKYYLDSNMVIDDDILMEQLSQNSTSKMHDIVSTIQKEQNILIRDDDFKNTIVQGVAGSGKTSIAMHRVSYLLYKYRKTLKSEDILILSPSELFADYINEVLPALGEEKSFTTTFNEMAKRLLNQPFENREAMLERVISKQNQKDFENIAIKSSFEFLADLRNFLNNDICNLFVPTSMAFGDVVINSEELHEIFFNKLKSISIHKRIDVIAESIVEKFKVPEGTKEDLLKRAKKLLYDKFVTTDLVKIYNLFLRNIGIDEIESIGAYDIAPILLIKENLFSLKDTYEAKYVIIDEMQDYTPCHFYLFEKIWDCAKLYLGDIYQSIDRTLSPSYLDNLATLTKSQIKHLAKSYRSTLQISIFSQKILGKHIADNVNRNGDEVEFVRTTNQIRKLEEIIESHKASTKGRDQTIAVICKTKEQVKTLQKGSSLLKKFKHLDEDTTVSTSKYIITTPAQAKSVEFDCVIIPFANNKNYQNELDKNLLYVSSTRALHNLYFVSDGQPSKFLLKKPSSNKNQ